MQQSSAMLAAASFLPSSPEVESGVPTQHLLRYRSFVVKWIRRKESTHHHLVDTHAFGLQLTGSRQQRPDMIRRRNLIPCVKIWPC